LKSIEQYQWANQKVIEQRIRVAQEYGEPLNDVFCYYTYVGGWKEKRPSDIVALKRKLDKIAYVNQPIFPGEFIKRHNDFMDLLYKTHKGWGVDAKLKTKYERRKEAFGPEWKEQWQVYFLTGERIPEPEEVREAYAEHQAYIATTIGIGLQGAPNVPAVLPINVR